MPITESELLENGYTKHPVGSIISPTASAFYQKEISTTKNILYYINLYMYNFEQYGLGIRWKASLQFMKGIECWNMDFQIPNVYTLEEVEASIQEMWSHNNFECYE